MEPGLKAKTSSRYLSFLETGQAKPSQRTLQGLVNTLRILMHEAAVLTARTDVSLLPGAMNLHSADCSAIWPVMVRWLGVLVGTVRSCLRTHRELPLENLPLCSETDGCTCREWGLSL